MDQENTLYIDLKDGRVVIEMLPKLAPRHVARIKRRARDGTGMGGMGERLPAEFSKEPHSRGAVSMARTNDPNSARSQFFICFKDANFLDGQYTVWGKVTSGMEHVDKIKKGEPPSNPDKMIKVQVAADVKE